MKAESKNVNEESKGKSTAKPKNLLTPSKELAQVIGPEPLRRPEALKKLWAYVRKEGLQDPKDKRGINADAKLKPVFGKDRISMFEMTKFLGKHLVRQG